MFLFVGYGPRLVPVGSRPVGWVLRTGELGGDSGFIAWAVLADRYQKKKLSQGDIEMISWVGIEQYLGNDYGDKTEGMGKSFWRNGLGDLMGVEFMENALSDGFLSDEQNGLVIRKAFDVQLMMAVESKMNKAWQIHYQISMWENDIVPIAVAFSGDAMKDRLVITTELVGVKIGEKEMVVIEDVGEEGWVRRLGILDFVVGGSCGGRIDLSAADLVGGRHEFKVKMLVRVAYDYWGEDVVWEIERVGELILLEDFSGR